MTFRQIDIIAYFCNHEGWVSSEQLSQALGLNKSTIKAEIKAITDELGAECRIESGVRLGYRLEMLTRKARERISRESVRCGGRHHLGYQPSALVLYFLFLTDYVTMQELSELFFMSKTAVSLEMETIKRWVKRYGGEIDLEISGRFGIRLHAGEWEKRVYTAYFGTINTYRSLPVPEIVALEYEKNLHAAGDILRRALVKEGYLLTGEEYRKNCRFIAGSILRSRMGYVLTEENLACGIGNGRSFKGLAGENVTGAVVKAVKELTLKEIGYCFTEAECRSIRAMLMESNTLGGRAEEGRDYGQSLAALRAMEEEICTFLGIEGQTLFMDRGEVLCYLEKMRLRSESGHVALTMLGEDIIVKYPLEVHMANRLLPKYFRLKANKEFSSAALFIATALKRFRPALRILLVSDQNSSILQQIRYELEHSFVFAACEWRIVPGYLFKDEPEMKKDYDLLLTTNEEILLENEEFYLIPPVLKYKDIMELNAFLKEEMERVAALKRMELKKTFLREDCVGEEDEQVCKILVGDRPETTFHSFGPGILYVCSLSEHEEIGIRVLNLTGSVKFRNKRIRKIVDTHFRAGDRDNLVFFDMVSELLSSYL